MTGDKALPKEIADQIIDRTDGVPLFIEELTKIVVDSGGVIEAGDHYAVTGCERARDPDTLQASLLARLDRLGHRRGKLRRLARRSAARSHTSWSARLRDIPQPQIDDALSD